MHLYFYGDSGRICVYPERRRYFIPSREGVNGGLGNPALLCPHISSVNFDFGATCYKCCKSQFLSQLPHLSLSLFPFNTKFEKYDKFALCQVPIDFIVKSWIVSYLIFVSHHQMISLCVYRLHPLAQS